MTVKEVPKTVKVFMPGGTLRDFEVEEWEFEEDFLIPERRTLKAVKLKDFPEGYVLKAHYSTALVPGSAQYNYSAERVAA